MKPGLDMQALVEDLNRVRSLAGRYAAALREHFGARLKRVILYGSGARGDWTTASDIDVLVLLDKTETPDIEYIVQTATAMGVLDSGLVLQAIWMTETEFQHLKNRERRFALEVEKDGVDL